jgi:hypothetical protein
MKFILITTVLYSLLPLLFYWFTKKKLNEEIKPIFPFVVLCFIAGLYEFIFSSILRFNTISWFYTYDLLAFFSIQYFFYNVLYKKVKKLVWITSCLYLILFTYAVIQHTIENYLNYLSYLTSFTTLLILIYSMKWFKKVFMETTLVSLADSPTFYFVTGFLFYYAGVVVLFLLADSIYNNNKSHLQYYWLINLFFNIFHKTVLIIGLWKARRN